MRTVSQIEDTGATSGGTEQVSPDLETMEASSGDPERGHIPTRTTAPPDTAMEVTTSIPASLPPLVPPSCSELGQIVQHPGGATRDTICSICEDPYCQGEQKQHPLLVLWGSYA